MVSAVPMEETPHQYRATVRSSTPPAAHVCAQVVLQWINELVSASDGLCALVGAQLLVPHRHNWIHDEGDGMCVRECQGCCIELGCRYTMTMHPTPDDRPASLLLSVLYYQYVLLAVAVG